MISLFLVQTTGTRRTKPSNSEDKHKPEGIVTGKSGGKQEECQLRASAARGPLGAVGDRNKVGWLEYIGIEPRSYG